MKYLLSLILFLFLPACTLGNFNSVYRSPTLKYGGSHIVDAKQRFVLTYPGLLQKDKDGNLFATKQITCAEPSPDVFSVFAASGETSVSKGGASGAGSFSTSETGASLVERTTSLQALRDSFFRLCEGYANGAIDEIDYMIGQRHNQTALMGLLAIQEMKAAAKAPPIIIGSSASANSASGIQTAMKLMTDTAQSVVELKQKKKAASDRLVKIEEDLPAARAAADPTKKPASDADDKLQKDFAAAEKNYKELKDEKDKKQSDIKDLQGKIEVKEKIIAHLAKSIENGSATGTMARSVFADVASPQRPVCDDKCGKYKAKMAEQMVEVVRLVDDNDYGPTICLSYLRRSSPPRIPSFSSARTGQSGAIVAQICKDVMDVYVESKKADSGLVKVITAAIKNDPGLLKNATFMRSLKDLPEGGMQALSLTSSKANGGFSTDDDFLEKINKAARDALVEKLNKDLEGGE